MSWNRSCWGAIRGPCVTFRKRSRYESLGQTPESIRALGICVHLLETTQLPLISSGSCQAALHWGLGGDQGPGCTLGEQAEPCGDQRRLSWGLRRTAACGTSALSSSLGRWGTMNWGCMCADLLVGRARVSHKHTLPLAEDQSQVTPPVSVHSPASLLFRGQSLPQMRKQRRGESCCAWQS